MTDQQQRDEQAKQLLLGLSSHAADALHQTLLATGLKASRDGEWVLLGVGPMMAICAVVQVQRPKDGMSVVTLAVHFQTAKEGPAVRESLIGVGRNDVDATTHAAQQWVGGVFPVLLRSLYTQHSNPTPDVVAESKHFDVKNGETWEIYAGPPQILSDSHQTVRDRFGANTAVVALNRAMESSDVEQEYNWASVFHRQAPGGAAGTATECFRNNEPWPEGRAQLEQLVWPAADKAYAVSQFVVLKRIGIPDAKPWWKFW